MEADLPLETAVVAHDAGAANLIFAWIDAGLIPGQRVYVEGPAAMLWRKRPRVSPASSIAAALDGATALLSGTGWATDLEHSGRRMARQAGLRNVAVIDHWVNYAARFERDGELILPDEIWVADQDAEKIATAAFDHVKVTVVPNLYLQSEVARVRPREDNADETAILYVAEPIRDNWGRETSGEFQALDFFYDRRKSIGGTHRKIRLRPHPSEPLGKYDKWIAARSSDVELDSSESLAEAISRADVVAGCNSFALVVALEAGREVVCTLPPWAPPCVLPHKLLRHLKSS